MKIAIFYMARTKSTMIHDVLAKKFNLEPLKEILFFSRRSKQSYDEYPELIKQINDKDNICVKICVNDFIDPKTCRVTDDYKAIDYTKFDHIIFVKRDDVMGNIASFGHHNLFDFDKSHRKKGQAFEGRNYEIDITKVNYILRAYRIIGVMRDWVKNNSGSAKLYDYKFETAEQQLINDFGLTSEDFDIDIEPCGLDYKTLAGNYKEIETLLPVLYDKMMSTVPEDFNNPNSAFWENNTSFI